MPSLGLVITYIAVSMIGGAIVGQLWKREPLTGMLFGIVGPIGWVFLFFVSRRKETAELPDSVKAELQRQRLANADPVEKWDREQRERAAKS